MLEAKNNDFVDMMLSFVAAMVDRCCGRFGASMTRFFVKFVVLCQFFFCYGRESEWSDLDVNHLSEQMQYFQCYAIKAFQDYQSSNMRMCK